jgi:hypothetical protein
MKFLCVPCDSPMKLQSVGPPEGGSLAVVYSCPECGYEMAMLTNPFETQMVQSLGVRIGPDARGAASSGAAVSGGAQVAAPRSVDDATGAGASSSAGRCPFAAMMPGVDGAREGSAPAAAEPLAVRWTPIAEARLANIPAFVRPMARTGIEQFAREKGVMEVDEKILDEARDFFGM